MSHTDDSPLSIDLVNFYDELVDFQCHCSFLFDAVTSLMLSNSEIDRASIEGFSSLSWQARRRANNLKEEFKRIQEKSRTLNTLPQNTH